MQLDSQNSSAARSTPAAVPPRARPRWLAGWGRAVLVVVAIEVGLLLVSLPWTGLWDHSGWIRHWHASHPGWAQAMLSPYLRGAVTGLGLVNLWNAASEILPFRS